MTLKEKIFSVRIFQKKIKKYFFQKWNFSKSFFPTMKKYFWIIFEVLKRSMSLLSIALQFVIISLYSSSRQGVTSQNYQKVAQRLAFTLSPSYSTWGLKNPIKKYFFIMIFFDLENFKNLFLCGFTGFHLIFLYKLIPQAISELSNAPKHIS